ACAHAPRTLPKTPAPPPLAYVALGGGEVLGDGTDDSLRDAWPQVLFRTALPRSATLVNFASSGATVDDLANRQVPLALATHPGLVTISLFDDLFDGMSVATYEHTLQTAVHQLRTSGARVLLGNIGLFDQRPGYRACVGASTGTATCALSGPAPQPPDLMSRTDALNAAIARVARAEGATLVDLHAAQVADRAAGREAAQYSDGITVNTEGARAIAAVFAAALPRLP
ncbi:MAG: SGNH/GDSL hydrolase family protein, partial [Actinobacteria bacterium]|nr:SGNH/GDSL hydrolase family protein [Actinomycetota bacterium]